MGYIIFYTIMLLGQLFRESNEQYLLLLERFAGGCDLCSITASVQTTPEDSSVPPQLSEHMCYLNFVFPL